MVAETIDRGHGGTLSPAVVRRGVGKGHVIDISSGLEAMYAETRMKPVRNYLASRIDPVLASHRTYEVSFQPGVKPHLAAPADTLLLHLVADTGNEGKKLRSREELLAGSKVNAASSGGWVEVTVPGLFLRHAVRVDLA